MGGRRAPFKQQLIILLGYRTPPFPVLLFVSMHLYLYSLAASLLPSGKAAVGFGGYVGSSRVDSLLHPKSIRYASIFRDIDSEMAQHLKRLARKDPTTKLKAFIALSLLLNQKSIKEIVRIIPQWTR